MSNAIKFTPDGGHISFTLTEKPMKRRQTGCFEFIFEDNGIGMSQEVQDIIFEPFFRADDKRTSKIQGTGLGLAITKNIVTMMDGNITVKSAPGKGSRFTITLFLKLQDVADTSTEDLTDLPVLLVDDDPNCCESTVQMLNDIGMCGEAATSIAPQSRNRFPGKRVLIVEDNALNMEIAVELVSMTDVTIETAENGKIAVEMVANAPENYYDLILMDIQMPALDGYEATAQIRALDKEYIHSLPIVAMTANAFAEDMIAAHKAGMDDYIAKPFDVKQLVTVMEKLL